MASYFSKYFHQFGQIIIVVISELTEKGEGATKLATIKNTIILFVPPKCCISIVSSFPWDLQDKNSAYAKSIMVFLIVANSVLQAVTSQRNSSRMTTDDVTINIAIVDILLFSITYYLFPRC